MAVTRIAFIAISMVLLSSVAMAEDYTVGDDKGWTLDFNYTQWAQDKVFHLGDTLWFNYDNTKHNVLQVDGNAFKNCNTSERLYNPLESGKDKIALDTPGRKWFICGIADHCSARHMKLVIAVHAEPPAAAPSAAHSLAVSPLTVVAAAAVTAVAAIFA